MQSDVAESHKQRTQATLQRFHRQWVPAATRTPATTSNLTSSTLAEYANGGHNMSSKDPKITVCWQVCILMLDY